MDFLSVVWNVDPVIFELGPLSVRYYGLLFIAGFPLGYWLFTKFYKREGVDVKLLEPLLYALLIGTIVGARLGHCLFYQPDYYLSRSHWFEIFMPWKGGLASHGGAIGVLLAIWWYCHKYGRKNGFDMMWILDRIAIAVAFAGCFIRLGNLMNSEIYGNPTDLPWGFIFVQRGETVAKHPTQLYEALSYLLLGFTLLAAYRYRLKSLKKGTLFGVFLTVLFGMRFLIEYVKEPQVSFEEGMVLNMGQLLSIPFIVAGLVILIWSLVAKRPAMAVVQQPKKHYHPSPKEKKKK